MAVARVVSFEGVAKERAAEVKRQIEEGERPEGMPNAEMIVLHDPEGDSSLFVALFESEDDYQAADAILNSMPAEDTPGRHASVTEYDVVTRMTG